MATTAKKEKKSTTDKKQKFSKETYVEWYKSMLLMRVFEERSSALYIQQKFGGFCHLYIGQEAILAGMVSAMESTVTPARNSLSKPPKKALPAVFAML